MAQVYTMCALYVCTYQRKHSTSHTPLFLLNYDSLNLIVLGWSSQAVARLARLGGEVPFPFMDT